MVLVLPAQTNEATRAFLALAHEAFPEAAVYPGLSRLAQAAQRHVLLVVQPERLEPVQWPALAQSLAGGTPLLFWGRNPLQRLQDDPPDLPMISPAFRYFDSPAAEWRRVGQVRPVAVAAPVQSPFPRPLGLVAPAPHAARWIPLAESRDSSGQALAWPASLWVEAPDHQPCRAWGWLGVDTPEESRDMLVALLREAAGRLQEGHFLVQAGPAHRALEAGRQLEVAVRLAHADSNHDLRVVAALVDTDGRTTRRVSAAAADWVTLNLGMLPRPSERARDYLLRITLTGADKERVYDEMEHTLRVLPVEGTGVLERVGVTGTGFTLGRRPVFLLGTPLMLRNGLGRMEGEPGRNPLEPDVFDPVAIRRELDRAQEAGFNLLHLALEHTNQVPQLRWLLEEIRPRGMWVQVQVAGLDPLALDLERAEVLLRSAPCLRDPALFAVEAGSQSRLGDRAAREAWDPAWRQWLQEQYGSVEHAEQVVGTGVWRRAGEITGPPDEALTAESAGVDWVAVYRRFVDDELSRRLGRVRRLLDEVGNQALVGARRGWGGPPAQFPLDPASGSVHLDFVQLDAEGLLQDEAVRPAAVRSAAYARGMSLGKPVVWVNLGQQVGPRAEAADLQRQAQLVQDQLDLAVRSHAAGLLVKSLVGGWRPDLGLDEGFTQPDGRWRPAGEVLRRFNQRVRREVTAPPSWSGPTVRRDEDARGLYGWLLKQRAGPDTGPAGAGMEVRPDGFGRTSFDAATASLGHSVQVDPAPWAWLNAEWGQLRTSRQTWSRLAAPARVPVRMELELELFNTGPARWINTNTRSAGAIWVRALHQAAAKEVWLPVPETPPGHKALVEWTPADAGPWELRAWNWGRGGFGEVLCVEVE